MIEIMTIVMVIIVPWDPETKSSIFLVVIGEVSGKIDWVLLLKQPKNLSG